MQAGREKREIRASLAGKSKLAAASPCGSALATGSLMGTRETWARTLVPRAVCHQFQVACVTSHVAKSPH